MFIVRESKGIGLPKLLSFILFFSALFALGFLIAVSQRGYDIADEGFHLLASQYPGDVEIWSNVAHIYTGLMYALAGKNIIILRIMSELFLFIAASFFFFGFSRLANVIDPEIKHKQAPWLIVWAMMCLGQLFYFVHFDLTPSYNSLNTAILALASGFFSLMLAKVTQTGVFSLIYSFVIGMLIGLLLLIKFPTAIALFFLYGFIPCIWPNIQSKMRLLNMLTMILGSCAWLLMHITLLQSWQSLWHTMSSGINVFLAFGRHNPSTSIFRYTPQIVSMFEHAIEHFWIIYCLLLSAMFAIIYIGKNTVSVLKNMSALILAVLVLMTGQSVLSNFYKGGAANSIVLVEMYMAWLLLLAMMLVGTVFVQYKFKLMINKKNKSITRIILFFLFVLPFAGAFGTANIITMNLSQYMAAWFALYALILMMISSFYKNRWIFLSGATFISFFACSQIISAGYVAPYNLNTTIQYQTVPTPIGVPSTYMLLDKSTNEFFKRVRQMTSNHGFKPGDDMLAFSNMPGIVFALGGKSPVVPWYLTLAHAQTINGWLLAQAPRARIRRAYILQSQGGGDGMPDLQKLGIRFPTDYILCGEAIWPLTGEWVKIWKPASLM